MTASAPLSGLEPALNLVDLGQPDEVEEAAERRHLVDHRDRRTRLADGCQCTAHGGRRDQKRAYWEDDDAEPELAQPLVRHRRRLATLGPVEEQRYAGQLG